MIPVHQRLPPTLSPHSFKLVLTLSPDDRQSILILTNVTTSDPLTNVPTAGAAAADVKPEAWEDSLDGMVARLESAGMTHVFSHAYASLLEVISANSFSAMNAHGQPSEAAQLLKGMNNPRVWAMITPFEH